MGTMGAPYTARILVVEDDVNLRSTLSFLLTDEGYRVDSAGSFAQALQILSAGESYDLVILDERLGDGWGSDLLPKIRVACPTAKAVMMSGRPMESRASTPADAIVPKGTAFDEILVRLDRVLDARGAARALR
jgi:DNA-binding response OmpR family regulator